MSSYKRFTFNASDMDAELSNAQKEMKTLSERLAAESVKIQSMMAEAHSAAYLVNVLHPALSAHVTLINMVDMKGKLITDMQSAMLQPVYFAALEACAESRELIESEDELIKSENELIESVVRTVNEDEIRGMIKHVYDYPENTTERPSKITEGTVAAIHSYNGPRSMAVNWCTPCVVVKCVPDGRFVVCFFEEYTDNFDYRIVSEEQILGHLIA